MPIQTDIVGSWVLKDSKHFDSFLMELDVGWAVRTIAMYMKPTLSFAINGNEWTMNSRTSFQDYTLNWKIGTASDEKTADGRDVSSIFIIEGDKLVQLDTGKRGGKDSRIERYIVNGELVIVCTCNGVKCTRVYEKAKA